MLFPRSEKGYKNWSDALLFLKGKLGFRALQKVKKAGCIHLSIWGGEGYWKSVGKKGSPL